MAGWQPAPRASEFIVSYAGMTVDSPWRIKRFSHRRRFEMALRLLGTKPGDKFLDYGSGDGYLVQLARQRLPEAEYWVYDPTPCFVEHLTRTAEGTPPIHVAAGTAELPDAAFDRLACCEVLEHLPAERQQSVLADLRRLARPGGTIVLSVPIEIGLPALLKNVVRAITGQTHDGSSVGNTLRRAGPGDSAARAPGLHLLAHRFRPPPVGAVAPLQRLGMLAQDLFALPLAAQGGQRGLFIRLQAAGRGWAERTALHRTNHRRKTMKRSSLRTAIWCAIGVCLSAAFSADAPAGDWPGWRGPTGTGFSDEKDLPLKWDGKTGEGVLWKALAQRHHRPFQPDRLGRPRVHHHGHQADPPSRKESKCPSTRSPATRPATASCCGRRPIAPGKEPAGYCIYAVPTPVTDGNAGLRLVRLGRACRRGFRRQAALAPRAPRAVRSESGHLQQPDSLPGHRHPAMRSGPRAGIPARPRQERRAR